jgi:hypothetical protein
VVPIKDEPKGPFLVNYMDDDNNNPANKALGAEANNNNQGATAVYPGGNYGTVDADEGNNNVDVNIPDNNVPAEHINNNYANEQESFQEEGDNFKFDNNNNMAVYGEDVDIAPTDTGEPTKETADNTYQLEAAGCHDLAGTRQCEQRGAKVQPPTGQDTIIHKQDGTCHGQPGQ